MGLAEIDLQRAEDCLNAYMTPVGDPHSPCIFHGSPLPTQILLFAELYNRTGDKELLRRYYPMIRQQYRFFADARYSGRAKETGLFSTWDIFYNSGGWDDYPAQKLIHEQALEKTVCPMVNVSFTVLCARILKLLAGDSEPFLNFTVRNHGHRYRLLSPSSLSTLRVGGAIAW
jgi:hypothetical protein